MNRQERSYFIGFLQEDLMKEKEQLDEAKRSSGSRTI